LHGKTFLKNSQKYIYSNFGLKLRTRITHLGVLAHTKFERIAISTFLDTRILLVPRRRRRKASLKA